MRKFSLIFCLLIGLQLSAQEESKPWSYSVGIGTTYRFPNTFGPELNTLLTSRSSFPQIATNVGIGVNYELSEVFTVGLQAWTVFFPKVETSVAKVTLSGLGVDAKVFYKLLETGGFSANLFLGAGVYHTASNISNDGFLVNRPPLYIPPGNTQLISGQLGYLDFGTQLWRVTTDSFRMGLQAGYITRLSGTDWKVSWGEPVEVLTPPTLSLLYLRLSVAFRSK